MIFPFHSKEWKVLRWINRSSLHLPKFEPKVFNGFSYFVNKGKGDINHCQDKKGLTQQKSVWFERGKNGENSTENHSGY